MDTAKTEKLIDALEQYRERETGTVDPGFRERVAAAFSYPAIQHEAEKLAAEMTDDNEIQTCERVKALLGDELTVLLPADII